MNTTLNTLNTKQWQIILLIAGAAILTNTIRHMHDVLSQTDLIHRHPFSVSNAAKSAQIHLINIAHNHDNQGKNNSLFNQELTIIRERFLGNPAWIDDISKSFADLQNSIQVNSPKEAEKSYKEINKKLIDIHEYATNKAQKMNNQAYEDFKIASLWTLLLAIYLVTIAIAFSKTKKNQLEKNIREIKKSKDWLENIMSASPEAILISDSEGTIIEANNQSCELFKKSKNDLRKSDINSLIPDKLKEQHKHHIQNFFSDNHPSRLTGRKGLTTILSNGKIIDVDINLKKTKIGNNTYCIAAIRDISEENRILAKIDHQANYDFLTNLPNRSLTINRFDYMQSIAIRDNTKLAFIFLDIDNFKNINDTLGHEAGDDILKIVSNRIRSCTRETDTTGRLGGDEFIILLGRINETKDITIVTDNILNKLNQKIEIYGHKIKINASIGISLFPENGNNYSELLRKSDSAMYYAKSLGGSQHAFYIDSMSMIISREFELENELHNALDKNEIKIVFQPQVETRSGKLIGFEALSRWTNSRLGEISPAEFIPIAERNGIIVNIGQFVIEQSLNFISEINNTTKTNHLSISINLSPRQLRDPDLISYINNKITKHKIKTHQLIMEITEGVLIEGSQQDADTLAEIANSGIEISMDDFGTGYSSLNYLRKYPFSHLKLDRSFVKDINSSKSTHELIIATINMAHALDMKIVAEGVETNEQLTSLQKINCDFTQGYLVSRPLPPYQALEFSVSNLSAMADGVTQPHLKSPSANPPYS